MAQDKSSSNDSRRNFLKIGAGVVAGAAIASVVEIPYYSSVIGGNNNNSSTTVSSLQDELSATKSQLSDTQNSLSATQSSLSQAQGTISNLNSQITATQGSLSSANSQLSNVQSSLSTANAQNATLSEQLSTTQGYLGTANSAISTLETKANAASSTISTLQSQNSSLQSQITQTTGFVSLNTQEVALVEAIAETMIPTDSNGPGATEAGVVYFIDGQLDSWYGSSSRMYMQGPFIHPNQTGSITVGGTTYSGGSPTFPFSGGFGYQYPITLKQFWKIGLQSLETYSNSAYGADFENLTSANQMKVLQDLAANKPTNFTTGPLASDFFDELQLLVWAGFLTDPIYGGNKNMVGWQLLGFNGLNSGNFFGEGHLSSQLMVATTPTRLQPASIAMLEAQGD